MVHGFVDETASDFSGRSKSSMTLSSSLNSAPAFKICNSPASALLPAFLRVRSTFSAGVNGPIRFSFSCKSAINFAFAGSLRLIVVAARGRAPTAPSELTPSQIPAFDDLSFRGRLEHFGFIPRFADIHPAFANFAHGFTHMKNFPE